jgi:hypothetical protein
MSATRPAGTFRTRRTAPAVRAAAGVRLLRAGVFAGACVLLAAAGHALASGRAVPPASLAVAWCAVFAFAVPLAGRERRLPGIAALLGLGQIVLHTLFSTGQMCASVTGSPRQGGADSLVAVADRLVCGGRAAHLTPQAAREIVVQAGLDPSHLAGAHLAGASSAMPGMWMPGDPAGPLPAGAHAAAMSLPSMLLSMCSLPMLLGHLLAATAAGWLLRRGEVALWLLIRLSRRGVAGLVALTGTALRWACALLAALAAAAPSARLRTAAAGVPPARHRTVWLRHSVARRGPPAYGLAA